MESEKVEEEIDEQVPLVNQPLLILVKVLIFMIYALFFVYVLFL